MRKGWFFDHLDGEDLGREVFGICGGNRGGITLPALNFMTIVVVTCAPDVQASKALHQPCAFHLKTEHTA